MQNYEVLKEISDVIEVRKQAAAESSYVSQLLHKGEDAILKKVIEEAGEVLMASKDGDKLHLIKEVASLGVVESLLKYHPLLV